jgi:UDP-glucuronate 4-epimerase
MLRVIVTGCAGFIGSHLCEKLLCEGHTVIGIDNYDPFYNRHIKEYNLKFLQGYPKFSFKEIDLRSGHEALSSQLSETYDAVIHLAAKAGVGPSISDPASYIENNLLSTIFLLEWMRKKDIKNIVFASSSSVYGNSSLLPFQEFQAMGGLCISPYATSKLACEELLFTYHHLHAFNVINARLFTVYGPRQRPDLAIHKFTALLRRCEAVPIYGDGSNARDYTYIDDIVRGLISSLVYMLNEDKVYEIINLGSGCPISLLELVHTLGEVTNRQPNIIFYPNQTGDVSVTYADNGKAKNLLGYSPCTSLVDGLSSFVQWFDKINS